MLTSDNKLRLKVTEQDVYEAIDLAIIQLYEKGYKDNLQDRIDVISFDRKVRGILAEKAISRFLEENGMICLSSEGFSQSADIDIEIQVGSKIFTVEVKSSVNDLTLEETVEQRSIPIIAKHPYDPELDVNRDIFIWVVYGMSRSNREKFLNGVKIDLVGAEPKKIYYDLKMYNFIEEYRPYFICWNERQIILKNTYLNGGFCKRPYWSCPAKKSFAPADLIKNLLYLGGKENE